jgi:hypothetical protein
MSIALVKAAIASGVTGCYEWDDKQAERVRNDPGLQGLTPEYIRTRLHEFIVAGGEIDQRRECRSEYSHREFWYMAIIPEPGFKHGIFVEMELTDEDADLPCVTLFNAHAENK